MITLLLLVLGDGLAEQKRLLLEAIANTNDTKAAAAIEKIAEVDSKEGVDALFSGIAALSRVSQTYEQERDRWMRVMEANSYDPETKRWKGPVEKYKDAKVRYEDFCAKLSRLGTISFAAGKGLRKMQSDSSVAELLARLKADGAPSARSTAAGALAVAKQADVRPALLAQFKKEKDAGVRVAIVDALREQCATDAIELLSGALKDEYWQVRVAAAHALKAFRARDAVEPLIDALKGAEGRLRTELNDALVAITGVDKHGDEPAWRSWWERNRAAFVAGTYVPDKAERRADAGGTTFYGLPVTSKRVVFVIDRSGSMKDTAKWKPEGVSTGGAPSEVPPPKGDRKFDVAKYELKKVLAMLPDGVEFDIVFFGTVIDAFSEKMVTLNKESRRRAFAYVDENEIVGSTNISGGLDKAFGFAGVVDKLSKGGVDTIFLLTDGMPTVGVTDPDGLCQHVAAANRGKKIAIHTIAIEPTEDSEKLMKRIARENGGSYAKR